MAKRLTFVLLVAAWGWSEANGQGAAAPTGGKSPLTPFLVRDAQGKMVPMPDPNPVKPVNYVKWINETLGAGIKDNAADLYEAAYKLYPKTDIKTEDLDKALEGPWDNLPAVATWLKANQACLDRFKEATKKRQCFFHCEFLDSADSAGGTSAASLDPRTKESFHGAGLPASHSTHQRICKAILAQGWQAWRRGDEDQIVEDALAVLRSARHLDDQVFSVENMTGLSCASIAYDALVRAMSLSRDSEAMAGRLAARLATADPPLELREIRGLIFEYAMLRDVCQRVFMPGDKPGMLRVSKGYVQFIAELSANEGEQPKPVDMEKVAQVGYETTLREFETVAKLAQGWLGKTHSAFLKDKEAMGRAVVSSKSPLVELVTPDLAFAYEHEEKRVASRRSTHLIAQLLVYHAKNHAYPDRLDDLKTADLKELRVDPFSEKDFVYKKQGKSFALYSVARNLEDDGGQHNKSWKEGDYVFWPVQP